MLKSAQFSKGSLHRNQDLGAKLDNITEDDSEDDRFTRTRSAAHSQSLDFGGRPRIESDQSNGSSDHVPAFVNTSSDKNQYFEGGTDPYFVPFAFVISTEIENHDIFREILVQLFESIRVP